MNSIPHFGRVITVEKQKTITYLSKTFERSFTIRVALLNKAYTFFKAVHWLKYVIYLNLNLFRTFSRYIKVFEEVGAYISGI